MTLRIDAYIIAEQFQRSVNVSLRDPRPCLCIMVVFLAIALSSM
jgi:hypothetical protein